MTTLRDGNAQGQPSIIKIAKRKGFTPEPTEVLARVRSRERRNYCAARQAPAVPHRMALLDLAARVRPAKAVRAVFPHVKCHKDSLSLPLCEAAATVDTIVLKRSPR